MDCGDGGEKSKCNLLRTMRMRTPITIKMVCTKSVQITAESPPAMQKNPAIANKTKIDKYNPESPANPMAYLMNNAPAYKSA